mmetsp:Transcript_7983/g.25381  ORF Transcript_7983/g.25381 Transcript_7983/m.25381 type:complete len:359 (-) Transcript_7983:1512-2588(-)
MHGVLHPGAADVLPAERAVQHPQTNTVALQPRCPTGYTRLQRSLRLHGGLREEDRVHAGDILQLLVREALRHARVGRAPDDPGAQVPEPSALRLAAEHQQELRMGQLRLRRRQRLRQQLREQLQQLQRLQPPPDGCLAARRLRRRQRLRRRHDPHHDGGHLPLQQLPGPGPGAEEEFERPDGDVRRARARSHSPCVRGGPRPPLLPGDLRLLWPLPVRSPEALREAAGHLNPSHGLPDAISAGRVPRLCRNLPAPAVQPGPQAAAGARRAPARKHPDLHRQGKAPGERVCSPARLHEGHAERNVRLRQGRHHPLAHVQGRCGLSKADDGASPGHRAHAEDRLDRPSDRGGVPGHRHLH